MTEAQRQGKRGRTLQLLEETARDAEHSLRIARGQVVASVPAEFPILCCKRASRLVSEMSLPPLVMDLSALGELGPRCLAKKCGRGGAGAAGYQTIGNLGCARSAVGCRSSPVPAAPGDETEAARWDDAATHVY